MQSPMMTMTREFRRRCWLPMIGVISWVLIPFSLLYGLLAYHTSMDFDNEVGRQIFFSFFMGTLMGCAFVVLVAQHPFERNYTLPVSARKLVCLRMFLGMLVGSLTYTLIAALVNLLFNAHWPILGPALYTAAVVAWSQAIAWSLRGSQLIQLFAAILSMVPIGLWLALRFREWPFQSAWNVSTTDLLIVSVAVAVIVPLAICGVARARRGDSPSFAGLAVWLEQLVDRTLSTSSWVQTRHQALFWYTFERKGFVLPLGVLAGTMIFAYACISSHIAPNEAAQCLIMYTMLTVLGAKLAGLFMGHQSEDSSMLSYRGTRPFSDSEMASTFLKAVLVSCVITWMIWLIGLTIFLTEVAANDQMNTFATEMKTKFHFVNNLSATSIVLFALTTLIAIWTFGGLSVSLFLCSSLIANIFVYAVTSVALALIAAYAFFESARPSILVFAQNFFAVTTFGLTWTLHLCAVYFGFLRLRTSVLCFFGLGVLGALYIVQVFGNQLTLPQELLAYGLLSLPFAPLALAPLSLAWNRHR